MSVLEWQDDRMAPVIPRVCSALVAALLAVGILGTAAATLSASNAPSTWLVGSLSASVIVLLMTIGLSTIRHRRRLEIEAHRIRDLSHLAYHDTLTGLANRRRVLAQLQTALAGATTEGTGVGFLFIDVDNFKSVNDTLGHVAGDALLQGVAARLVAAAGGGVVGRLGGDEFTVLYPTATAPADIQKAAERIVEAFTAPLAIDTGEVAASVSIGASFGPDHGGDVQTLMRAADAALFRAKAEGRSQARLFTPELLAAVERPIGIQRRSLRDRDRDEFDLVFQPALKLGGYTPITAPHPSGTATPRRRDRSHSQYA